MFCLSVDIYKLEDKILQVYNFHLFFYMGVNLCCLEWVAGEDPWA